MSTVAANEPRRPLPLPTPLTEEYWDAAAAGRLLYARCNRCGQVQFPREFACVACQSLDVSWVEGTGKGRVYSYTVIHREPFPDFPVPAVMAIVDLDEGYSMFSNIVDCPRDRLRCDMPVEVTFERQPDGFVLPVFRPA